VLASDGLWWVQTQACLNAHHKPLGWLWWLGVELLDSPALSSGRWLLNVPAGMSWGTRMQWMLFIMHFR
jgi:hypothetical protein